MVHTWIVSVARSNDWMSFNVALIGRLLDKGLSVKIGYCRWEVEISEWAVFVSAMASVWAEISRWSDFPWMMIAVYTVRLRRDDSEKWRLVQLKVAKGGVRYGSIAI